MPKIPMRNTKLGKPGGSRSGGFNPLPTLGFGLLLTVAWIVGCLVLASSVMGGVKMLSYLTAAEWAMIITGACLPLFLGWTFILGSLQHQAMKASLLKELAHLSKPEPASSAINMHSLSHMNAVSDELEARFEGFHQMADDLSSMLVGMTAQMETQNHALDSISERFAARSHEIATHLANQTAHVDTAEARVNRLVERVTDAGNTVHALTSELREEVEAPILSMASNIRDSVIELEDKVSLLDRRLEQVSATHSTVLQTSEQSRARLAEESERLHLASEGASANIDSISTKLADQITHLDSIGLNAAQEIASISAQFDAQAGRLGTVTEQLSEHIGSIAGAIDTQSRQLQELGDAANNYGAVISEQVRTNASILNEETDSAVKRLRDTMADLSLAANEMSRNESDRLDDVKERVTATLATLTDQSEHLISEMSIRAQASASVLEAQSNALSQRLETVSGASDALHQRLTKTTQEMAKDLTEALDKAIHAHATGAGSAIADITRNLDTSLEHWSHNVDEALVKAKDSAHSLVATTAESLKHLSDESAASIVEAGQRIPSLAEAILVAAGKTRTEVNEISGELQATLARVVQTVDDTSAATQLMQRDLAEAPARLDAATKALSNMTAAISNHAQGVEIHANDIEAASDRVVVQLDTHAKALQDAALVTDRVLEEQNARLASGTAQVLDLTQHFAERMQDVTAQAAATSDQILQDQSQRLERSTDKVLNITERFAARVQGMASDAETSLKAMADLSADTVGAVSVTSESVGHQIADFKRQADDLRGLLNSIGGLANEHGMALQKVGEEAESRAGRLMGLVKNDQRDAFLGSAERLVDRLHGLAVDVDSIMDGEIDQDVIRAFQSGDRGVAVRKLIMNSRGNGGVHRVAQLYSQDAKFKERVDHYLDGFDDLLSRAAKADSTKLLHTTFLTADIGKLYVFLTQSLGVLAAAE